MSAEPRVRRPSVARCLLALIALGCGRSAGDGDPAVAATSPDGPEVTHAGGSGGSAGDGTNAAGSGGASLGGATGTAAGGPTGGNPPTGGAGTAGAAGTATAGDSGSSTADAGPDGGIRTDPNALAFVPEQLEVMNLSGENTGFEVVALTLAATPDGPVLYATLQNDRDISGCDAAASFELFDDDGVSVGAWVGALFSEQLFRRTDGSGGLIACIEPGQRATVALVDLPAELAIDDVRTALYQLTYFDRSILPFELEPVDDVTVTGLTAVEHDPGFGFTGQLENRLDVPLEEATVTVFPLNALGRPLGMATTPTAMSVEPGQSWSFETTAVVGTGITGVELVAYATGTVSF